jgi:hypothetical protein
VPLAPASAAVPESKITTVVVPAQPKPAASLAAASDRKATSPPVLAMTPTGTATPSPAPRPAVATANNPPARSGSVPSSSVPAAVTVAPALPASVVATPSAQGSATAAAPAPLPAPPVAVTAASQAAKPAVAKGPEAICEGRNPLLYFVCMERECLRSKFSEHADCLKWRQEARREVN